VEGCRRSLQEVDLLNDQGERAAPRDAVELLLVQTAGRAGEQPDCAARQAFDPPPACRLPPSPSSSPMAKLTPDGITIHDPDAGRSATVPQGWSAVGMGVGVSGEASTTTSTYTSSPNSVPSGACARQRLMYSPSSWGATSATCHTACPPATAG